jgi:hypothetical protein
VEKHRLFPASFAPTLARPLENGRREAD